MDLMQPQKSRRERKEVLDNGWVVAVKRERRRRSGWPIMGWKGDDGGWLVSR